MAWTWSSKFKKKKKLFSERLTVSNLSTPVMTPTCCRRTVGDGTDGTGDLLLGVSERHTSRCSWLSTSNDKSMTADGDVGLSFRIDGFAVEF